METVNVLQRGYKRTLQYERKRICGNFGRTDDRYFRAEQNGPYSVRDGIAITMDDLSRAVAGGEVTISGTDLAVDLLGLFQESTMQHFMALLHEIGEKAK